MTAGYWATNYFPLNYWVDDYWPIYGLVIPPAVIFCNKYRLWILTGRL